MIASYRTSVRIITNRGDRSSFGFCSIAESVNWRILAHRFGPFTVYFTFHNHFKWLQKIVKEYLDHLVSEFIS